MQVAVADVAVGDQTDAGQPGPQRCTHLRDEGREIADRQGHVVLQARALIALGLGDAFAEQPEGLALGRTAGDDGVEDELALERLTERSLERLVELDRGGGRGELDQAVPGVRSRGRAPGCPGGG